MFEHNVGKAKQLLEEAGVQTPIKFTLYSTDQSWITQLAPQIKNNLAEIGMDVDLQSMASSALYPNITDRDDADFSMALVAGDPSVFGNDADLLMNWFYGDNTWTHQRTFWYGSDGYKQLHELMDKAKRQRTAGLLGPVLRPAVRTGSDLPALPPQDHHRLQERRLLQDRSHRHHRP